MKQVVKVFDRETWQQEQRVYEITVDWVCPECGGPRGDIVEQNFHFNGQDFPHHIWQNPCGHKDSHAAALQQAKNVGVSTTKGRPKEAFEKMAAESGGQITLRQSQIELSELVADSINDKTWMIAEAGTGTGKSNAYIVPALLSSQKVTISTATKSLQDQVYFKDIENMMKSLNIRKKAVLYKGANNYLCKNRLEGMAITSEAASAEAEVLFAWLEQNPRGDLNDYPAEIVMGQYNISVDTELCRPRSCPMAGTCPWVKLREEVQEADIVVTNHTLLLLSKEVRTDRFLVIDEGHEMVKIATDTLAMELNLNKTRFVLESLYRYNDGMLSSLMLSKDQLTVWLGMLNNSAVRIAGQGREKDRIMTDQTLLQGIDWPEGMFDRINNYIEEHPKENISKLLEKVLRFLQFVEQQNSGRTDIVTFAEKQDDNITYRITLRYIAPMLNMYLWSNDNVRGGVLLSASLRYNGHFNYILSKLGFPEDTPTHLFESPFDYSTQARMLVPSSLLPQKDPDYRADMSRKYVELIKQMKGRTLILFTSIKRMLDVYEDIKDLVPYKVLVQNNGTIAAIKEEFIQDTHSVLLAVRSFWTGIDIPGETLSCVAIDTIPFPSIGDPIIEATTENMTNGLLQYLVPEAALLMCQGAGRLIRTEQDFGLIVLMDERLVTRQYRERFFNTLPPVPLVNSLGEAVQWMEEKAAHLQ
ncbi:putative ATP-dependent helicase DinG [compost metagenome]